MERYKWSFVHTFIGVIFFLVGAVFLIIMAANTSAWAEFKKDAVPVTAEITDIDTYTKRSVSSKKRKTYHDVYIEYEYEGKTYTGELNYYSSGMKRGDDVEIFIDPENPSESKSDPLIVSGIMGIFVIIFGGIGSAFLVFEFKKSRYINRLIADDKFVYADYSHEERANVTVNNVRYNQAVFVYEDGFGRKLMFKSEPYHPNSRPYIQGDSKKVYVDMENNPKKYYVSREK